MAPSVSIREKWIVAQGHAGHRLMYVRLLAEAALDRGLVPVIVISAAARQSVEFDLHLRDLMHSARFIALDSVDVKAVLDVLPTDTRSATVFPEGDAWLRALAFRRTAWPGGAQILVMRPSGQSSHPVLRTLQSAAKAGLRMVGRMRPGVSVRSLRSVTERAKLWTLPDPVRVGGTKEGAHSLRLEWSRSAPNQITWWVGVLGALNARKNVGLIAEAVASMPGRQVGLVVAGHCSDGEAAMTSWLAPALSTGVPVIRVGKHLTDDELDSMVRALDCLVLAHSNEGPSGMLGKAKAVGTRLVLSGAISLKRDARNLGDGTLWVPLSSAALAEAIGLTLRLPAPPPRSSGLSDFTSGLLG